MKNRNLSLDVIRCTALFCVISVHFFGNSGFFYNQPVNGFPMFLLIALRNIFIICVPLFLLLSGYLMTNKQPSPAYYLKLIYTLFIYAAASLCCFLYSCFFLGEPFSPFVLVFGTTGFSNAPYAWYVEMYIGLFLLIPFLNVLYHGLHSRKEKQLLLLTLMLLTALPSVVNIYCFRLPGWWSEPAISDTYKQLIPAWWENLYPVTYYFLGCYLREYPVKLKRSKHALAITAVILLTGLFNYYRSRNHLYVWGPWQEYRSVPVLVLAALVFSFLLQIDYSGLPSVVCRLISKISQYSLGAYLVSWIFDSIFYPLLINHVSRTAYRMLLFPVVVGAVLLCSTALSALLDCLYRITLAPLLNRLQKKQMSAEK